MYIYFFLKKIFYGSIFIFIKKKKEKEEEEKNTMLSFDKQNIFITCIGKETVVSVSIRLSAIPVFEEEGMGNPPFQSLRYAFLLSVSLAASYTTTSAVFFPKLKPNPPSQPHSQSAISVPKATAKDLITLLGPPHQASSVNQQEATDLKSCFKFLVPFAPATKTQPEIFTPARRSLSSVKLINKSSKEVEDNELIWWPPEPVMELARLAIDSGGDPGVIHRALDPTVIQVNFFLLFIFFVVVVYVLIFLYIDFRAEEVKLR